MSSKNKPSKATQEKRIHSNREVPYSVYTCDMPKFYPNVPIHWHNEYEIDYVLDGAGEFVCGDMHFVAHKGDIILSLPNMIHAAYPEEGKRLYYKAFVFSSNMLGQTENDRSYNDWIRPLSQNAVLPILHYTSDFEEYGKVKELVEEIIDSSFKNDSYEDLLLKSNLYRLFYIISQDKYVAKESTDDISYAELIRPSLDYMADNYNEPISIDTLAELCSISTSYFMSSFKKAVGFSAIEYLNHLRIKQACARLSDSKEDISEIAGNCGYNNLSNFNRQFKRIVGCSPRDYRLKK